MSVFTEEGTSHFFIGCHNSECVGISPGKLGSVFRNLKEKFLWVPKTPEITCNENGRYLHKK